MGAPSMTREEFQALRADPHPILGASIRVLAPTGDYNPDRLLNVGANRWAVKPELGYMIPLATKWLLELEAGVWNRWRVEPLIEAILGPQGRNLNTLDEHAELQGGIGPGAATACATCRGTEGSAPPWWCLSGGATQSR